MRQSLGRYVDDFGAALANEDVVASADGGPAGT